MDRQEREQEKVRKRMRTEYRVRRLFGRVIAILRILVAVVGNLSPATWVPPARWGW